MSCIRHPPLGSPQRSLDTGAAFTLSAALLFLLLPAHPAQAQVVEPRTPVEHLEVGGRVHFQFNTTSATGDAGAPTVPASEFLLRRARIWVAGRVNDWIDGVVQVEVSGDRATARYAFLRFRLAEALQLAFGQFKRAFDVFALTSSSRLLTVERSGDVRGIDACAGVGGTCSYSRLNEQLRFSSLDIGVLATGNLGPRARYSVSLTNGTGPNTAEENGAKSVSGRLEVSPAANLRLAANLGWHDFPNPVTGRDGHAPAAALDVEWGTFEGGPHLQAGVVAGENWRNLSALGEASDFWATQVIATYRFPLTRSRIRGIEPVARVSWADPDRDHSGDAGLLVTPGLVLHFVGRNKLGANLDYFSPGTGSDAWSLKLQTYLYF